MDTLGKRIKSARTTCGLTQSQVAATFGIDRVNISQWESDTTKPELERLPTLAELLGVSVAWLLDGKGLGPVKGAKPKLVGSFDPDEPDTAATDGNGFNGDFWKPTIPGALPEVDAEAGAGLGAVGEVVNVQVGNEAISAHKVVAEWYIPDQFLLHQAGASPRQSIVMEVRGDSMQPEFLPGDRVIVDLSQREFTVDGVYVFSDGHGEPQIKRLQKVMFSDPVVVRIISDNPAYDASDVELSRVHIIGRARGHVGRM